MNETPRTCDEITAEIEDIQTQIKRKKQEILDFEIDVDDCRDKFDEALDDCYDFSSIGGPFQYMQPSTVLKEVDPTAYRCGLADFADSQDKTEYDEYKELETELSDLEDELEVLESELAELGC